jgi:4-hydroxy-3-methylbut-2-enyl diphosphate reductase
VVLSNRLAEEERRAEMRDQVFTQVSPGDILEGTVRRLTDYGAFVDLGGIDGLLHISEMSWMRISHPREVLKEGQKIKVMVLRLDPEAGKISLGLRQVLPDPWNLIRENYRVGQKITCKIGRMVQSGAFVKLPEGAEAFLPIGEISNRRIGKPSDVLTEGQEVELTIIDLRPDERRMVTSLRGGATPEPSYHGEEPAGFGDDDLRGRRAHGGGGRKKRRGAGGGARGGRRGEDDEYETAIVGRIPTGGATIGERLGMLKGFQVRPEADDLAEGMEPLEEQGDSELPEPTESAPEDQQPE